MLSRLVITFLPRSKRLLISWLQSPSAVILEPPKIKSDTVSTASPSISHEVMGPDAMILVFWMLSFKPTFSLSSFTFIKRLFSSCSLSAIRVVSSAYLRLLIFLPAILIPVQNNELNIKWSKIKNNFRISGLSIKWNTMWALKPWYLRISAHSWTSSWHIFDRKCQNNSSHAHELHFVYQPSFLSLKLSFLPSFLITAVQTCELSMCPVLAAETVSWLKAVKKEPRQRHFLV